MAKKLTVCLNPCFNGRYSQRMGEIEHVIMRSGVLILVLMEDTLRAYYYKADKELVSS